MILIDMDFSIDYSQARALRQEREKLQKKRQSQNHQVRLSYDAQGQSFVLGGGQDEIHRILADLSKMSQIKTVTSPSPIQTAQHDVEQSLASSNDNNKMSPMPSPTPLRPLINSPHSIQLHLESSTDI